MSFLELEGAYITIAIFILIIGAIVTTRKFMPKNAFKKGMPILFGILTVFILLHYYITTNRMSEVKSAFESGKIIICERRENRKASQSILISKDTSWRIEDGIFVNDQYSRGFHSARCLVYKED